MDVMKVQPLVVYDMVNMVDMHLEERLTVSQSVS